jgi:hypothetical protein
MKTDAKKIRGHDMSSGWVKRYDLSPGAKAALVDAVERVGTEKQRKRFVDIACAGLPLWASMVMIAREKPTHESVRFAAKDVGDLASKLRTVLLRPAAAALEETWAAYEAREIFERRHTDNCGVNVDELCRLLLALQESATEIQKTLSTVGKKLSPGILIVGKLAWVWYDAFGKRPSSSRSGSFYSLLYALKSCLSDVDIPTAPRCIAYALKIELGIELGTK